MSRILLTGGTGMVGRSILSHHAAQHWEILAPTRNELDLKDENAVRNYIKINKPDLVIHAAGVVGGIHANVANPVSFLDSNIILARNVIINAWREGVRDFINLGSTCMYPAAAPNPLTEDMIMTGALEQTNEGYALAKIIGLRLCTYINQEDPRARFRTLIPCNLYGPHDKFDPTKSHLLAAIIHKIHTAKTKKLPGVEIWGDGTARREFMYAPDLADAVMLAASDISLCPEVANIGLGYDLTVAEYYQIVADVIGWMGDFTFNSVRPVGVNQKLCDVSRARQWGWQASTNIVDGIRNTYKFYCETYLK